MHCFLFYRMSIPIVSGEGFIIAMNMGLAITGKHKKGSFLFCFCFFQGLVGRQPLVLLLTGQKRKTFILHLYPATCPQKICLHINKPSKLP